MQTWRIFQEFRALNFLGKPAQRTKLQEKFRFEGRRPRHDRGPARSPEQRLGQGTTIKARTSVDMAIFATAPWTRVWRSRKHESPPTNARPSAQRDLHSRARNYSRSCGIALTRFLSRQALYRLLMSTSANTSFSSYDGHLSTRLLVGRAAHEVSASFGSDSHGRNAAGRMGAQAAEGDHPINMRGAPPAYADSISGTLPPSYASATRQMIAPSHGSQGSHGNATLPPSYAQATGASAPRSYLADVYQSGSRSGRNHTTMQENGVTRAHQADRSFSL